MERFDSHMHTPLCGHAFGEPIEFVEAAAGRGLQRITFTCHMPFDEPSFGGARMRMQEADLPRYLEMVGQARARGEELGVEVLTGVEGEIFPDPAVQEAIGAVLQREPFDFILGSMHHHTAAFHEYLDFKGHSGNDDAIVEAYFQALAAAPATGLFHSLSHPDVIRLYGTIEGPFEPARHEAVIREAIQAAVDHDVCWEINTSGRIKGDFVEHPDPLIRKWALEMGLSFTIGSDAHLPNAVGQHFDEVIAAAQAEGLDALHYFRAGERIRVPLDGQTVAKVGSSIDVPRKPGKD